MGGCHAEWNGHFNQGTADYLLLTAQPVLARLLKLQYSTNAQEWR